MDFLWLRLAFALPTKFHTSLLWLLACVIFHYSSVLEYFWRLYQVALASTETPNREVTWLFACWNTSSCITSSWLRFLAHSGYSAPVGILVLLLGDNVYPRYPPMNLVVRSGPQVHIVSGWNHSWLATGIEAILGTSIKTSVFHLLLPVILDLRQGVTLYLGLIQWTTR